MAAPKLLDSRRLTGLSLLLAQAGAVIDVATGDHDANEVEGIWREQLGRVLAAVGWAGAEIGVRRTPSGLGLAFTAPIDALYAATEVNVTASCGAEAIRRLITGGLFQYVKIPAEALMRMPGTQVDNLADVMVPLAREHSVKLIASDAEHEHHVVGLIDADVYLAQGDVLVPPRPIRADLASLAEPAQAGGKQT